MIVFYKEALEAISSMKKALEIIESKLAKEEVHEDVEEFTRYQIRADWVKAEIKSWEKLLNE